MFHRFLSLSLSPSMVVFFFFFFFFFNTNPQELQSKREPQTRAILIMPVLIQVPLFPFAATLEVTNATIAIHNEDSGRHAVELHSALARAKALTHVPLLQSPQAIQPPSMNKSFAGGAPPADFAQSG